MVITYALGFKCRLINKSFTKSSKFILLVKLRPLVNANCPRLPKASQGA